MTGHLLGENHFADSGSGKRRLDLRNKRERFLARDLLKFYQRSATSLIRATTFHYLSVIYATIYPLLLVLLGSTVDRSSSVKLRCHSLNRATGSAQLSTNGPSNLAIYIRAQKQYS